VRPKPGRRGEAFLIGEEVVQDDVVHLLWGLGPGEGREAPLGTPVTVGEPLGRPKALGGGGQQDRRPVLVFGGLDCLEVPRFRGASNFPRSWVVILSCRSDGLMIFTTEDGQVGSPPGFGVMGRSGYWCLFFEESY